MDMLPMSTGEQMPMDMHNTFWRDDQLSILFQLDIPVITNGMLDSRPLSVLKSRLPEYLQTLNTFLAEQHLPATLNFLDGSNPAKPTQPAPSQPTVQESDQFAQSNSLQLPTGIYPFGFTSSVESSYGPIRTSVTSFLQVSPVLSQQGGGNAAMTMPPSSDGDTGDGIHSPAYHLIPVIVNTLNSNLDELHKRQLPITIAAPTWLSGGTPQGTGQGCPLTPPMPVEDSCSSWHIELPDLSADLEATTGDGVTVFVLDAFPERGVIARAARDARDDNRLLRNVNETVTFDYSLMSGIQEVQSMADTSDAYVGKDVYGRHYPMQIADHGLFIAGMIRDIASKARIECIRVLNDLCVGDTQLIANALWNIYLRKALQSGDLYNKPVAINLSLVIPTDAQASSQSVINPVGTATLWDNVKNPLLALNQLGVIVAASAGNEGDQREMSDNRPPALYPAAFGNPPYSMNGIIPVGAVNAGGNATTYSCYPGPRGVATYGGEIPKVTPPMPPSSNPIVDASDMVHGIYSSVEFPPLSSDPPEQYYAAPNDHAWACWVGTSFATPIIIGLVARMLEAAQQGNLLTNIHDAVLNAATATTQWDNLDPGTPGTVNGAIVGPVFTARQRCRVVDRDEEYVAE